jgi:SAM-dependent methyltransferase
MNKHNPLTADELVSFRPQAEVLRYVEGAAPRSADAPLRVLDWGCGRGRLVAFLLNRGMDSYGVDVDPDTLANGQGWFDSAAPGDESRLRLLDADGRTPFPDGYFDIVVSDNVLEHVAGLDRVFAEISRLIRPGGCSFHLFPARFTLREGHLMMPLVHWLPKGPLRRLAIRLFTRLGMEPRWEELAGLSATEKADAYFAYSRDKTFYRTPSSILAACARHGLEARLVGTEHPRMACVRNVPGLSGFAEMLIANLKAVELYLKKPVAAR